MFGEYLPLDRFHGKQIESIDFDEYDEVMVIKFTDRWGLVLVAEPCNAAGARIRVKLLRPREEDGRAGPAGKE